ncbi:MAG TPA: hypothetical protein PKJ63_00325 [Cyclobacteriaceae bacterium]|nr:hypothetical protein [Cyclobacteriaceae bacterium]
MDSTITKKYESKSRFLTRTKPMIIIDDPQQAVVCASHSNDGIALVPLDHIIIDLIQVHPLALKHFDALEDPVVSTKIAELTHPFLNKKDYFILNLARSIATVAAAFEPKDLFVQLSHLTTAEWRGLIGGEQFESIENNPLIGLRGAMRCVDPEFRPAFDMECEAIKIVREEMGFSNIKLVIPFCRTGKEADQVVRMMNKHGMYRGCRGFEIFMTVETPCNAIMASRFAKHVDGFLICPVNLSRLMLGSEENLLHTTTVIEDPVIRLITRTLHEAKRAGIKVGLKFEGCGKHPDLMPMLVDQGIDFIAFCADNITEGIRLVAQAENRFTHTKAYY